MNVAERMAALGLKSTNNSYQDLLTILDFAEKQRDLRRAGDKEFTQVRDALKKENEDLRKHLGHVAPPGALGWNVLEFAPPGAVTLSVKQREDALDAVRRTIKAELEAKAWEKNARTISNLWVAEQVMKENIVAVIREFCEAFDNRDEGHLPGLTHSAWARFQSALAALRKITEVPKHE